MSHRNRTQRIHQILLKMSTSGLYVALVKSISLAPKVSCPIHSFCNLDKFNINYSTVGVKKKKKMKYLTTNL